MMNGTIASFLKEFRMVRGLSQRELARQAGVAQSSLTRWEQGRFLPRLPELEAVLNALNVSPEERFNALQRLNAPRALERLATVNADMVESNKRSRASGVMPSGGDLLRAMRLRAGKTLDELAVRLGVTTRTLRRWEQGETWPDTASLHFLCYELKAYEQEVAILTRGRGGLTMESDTGCPFDPDAIIHRLYAIRGDASPQAHILKDLKYLALAATLWSYRNRHPQATPLLFFTLAFRARFLWDMGRITESAECARRVFALEDQLSDHIRFHIYSNTGYPLLFANQHCEAVIAASTRLLDSASFANRKRGRRLLLEEQARWERPEYQAWMLSQVAESLGKEGQAEAALRLNRQAIELSRALPDRAEYFNRRRDEARLLAQAGHYTEAIIAVEETAPLGRFNGDSKARHLLLQAECLIGLHQFSEAHDLLLQINTLIASDFLPHLRERVDLLASRL